jgi:hypothetical protein
MFNLSGRFGMNTPGFVAEASLYKSRTQYRMNAGKSPRAAEAHVFPQAKNIVGSHPGANNDLCQKAGDLVNEAWQESQSTEGDESREWQALASEFVRRSKDNWDCSFQFD